MKGNVEILAFIERTPSIDDLLKDISRVTYIDSREKLHDRVKCDDGCIYPRILLVNIDYILDKRHPLYVKIEEDLMYKNASVIIYGKNIPLNLKRQLYDFDIKGIIDEDNENRGEVFTNIRRRTNLYSASFKNNFMKAKIDYLSFFVNSRKLTYTFNYLIFKYNISDRDASDIRVALIMLLNAFEENKLTQKALSLKTLFK